MSICIRPFNLNNLLNLRNSGFRKNHSTIASLLKNCHDIISTNSLSLSQKVIHHAVYINFKLQQLSIGGSPSSLNFLVGRLEHP